MRDTQTTVISDPIVCTSVFQSVCLSHRQLLPLKVGGSDGLGDLCCCPSVRQLFLHISASPTVFNGILMKLGINNLGVEC